MAGLGLYIEDRADKICLGLAVWGEATRSQEGWKQPVGTHPQDLWRGEWLERELASP